MCQPPKSHRQRALKFGSSARVRGTETEKERVRRTDGRQARAGDRPVLAAPQAGASLCNLAAVLGDAWRPTNPCRAAD